MWGCGKNDWGQLAQGTRDYDVHSDKVKIAENVVHVDYSREGIGTEQKTVSGEADYTVTCSSEFVPYEFPQ